MHVITAILMSIVSGILLFVSFPAYDLSFLAWFALVPLFVTIAGKKPGHAFLLSFVWGVTFFAGIFYWIFEVPRYRFLHESLFALYLGPCLGVFGLAFNYISRRSGFTAALFAAPFLWVSLEYIRSNLSFLALPWALLAHSQYLNPPVIQIASFTGAHGVSFLIVTVNAAIAATFLPFVYWLKKSKQPFYQFPTGLGRLAVVVTAGALAVLALVYGHMTLSEPMGGRGIKISVVQGNIEQERKWDPKYAKFIMDTYADLTQRASRHRPALIIWPEGATPRAINRDPALYGQVRHIARTAEAYLLLGSSQHQKFKEEGSKEVKYLNSAFLIPPEMGRARTQRYDKIRLLPFGEYLPLKGTIPWSYIKIPDISSYVPGKEFTLFEAHEFRFGVTICWESIFPDLVRQFVKGGAQFIVNITNEAWFGKTAAPYQFVSMSVFRAVENRLFVVRCANTGVSCFIDPYGRVVDRVKDTGGRDTFVRGVLTETVIPMESKTIYTRYGDWLAWLSLACSPIFLVTAFLSKSPTMHSIPSGEAMSRSHGSVQ